jgi:hypothetical protein
MGAPIIFNWLSQGFSLLAQITSAAIVSRPQTSFLYIVVIASILGVKALITSYLKDDLDK